MNTLTGYNLSRPKSKRFPPIKIDVKPSTKGSSAKRAISLQIKPTVTPSPTPIHTRKAVSALTAYIASNSPSDFGEILKEHYGCYYSDRFEVIPALRNLLFLRESFTQVMIDTLVTSLGSKDYVTLENAISFLIKFTKAGLLNKIDLEKRTLLVDHCKTLLRHNSGYVNGITLTLLRDLADKGLLNDLNAKDLNALKVEVEPLKTFVYKEGRELVKAILAKLAEIKSHS